MRFWEIVAVVVGIIAIVVWIELPRRLTRRSHFEADKERIEAEDVYRKNIGQLMAAIVVVTGLYFTGRQLIDTERAAVQAQVDAVNTANDAKFEKGFEFFTSNERVARVGGIHDLEILLEDDRRNGGTRQAPILEGLAAAAVTFSQAPPGARQAVLPPDAQAALRAVSRVEPVQELPLRFDGGYFAGAQIPYAYLNGTSFQDANLAGSDLYDAHLYNVNFRGATLNGASMAGADLSNAGMQGAHLCMGRNLAVPALESRPEVATGLAGAKMYGTVLDDAWLIGANLEGAVLWNASLDRVHLESADIQSAQFHHASLVGADLREASAQGADFGPDGPQDRPTNMRGADLRSADLSHAVFRYADLRGASLSNANLTDADFSNAQVTGIAMTSLHFCRTKWVDGKTRGNDCAYTRPQGPVASCPAFGTSKH
jgi:hypothetical protein